ncbi:MAG: hypothetical protein EP347_06035 [Alphaproteobacteria bacterium]|nr:MAG: hypothetical protein EP347_06035 [Alphaproteobacteria bacterium]
MRILGLFVTLGLFVISTAAQAEDETTEVFKPDGSLQCEATQAITLTEMARDLRRRGIGVLDSRKGHDGVFRMTMCGASTGNINIFSIFLRDLTEAEEIGFRVLDE